MIRHRLKGSVFRRESSGTLEPYRVIFLSVEGKKTEPHYFEGLNRELSRGQLPFPRRVIKVLKKEDHNSDPGSVIALLEEYLALRHERYDHVFPPVFLKKYEHSTIRRYFQGMYFVDVSQEYDMRELFENRPVSRNHSFVSGELSRISRTNKRVNFEQYADKLMRLSGADRWEKTSTH